MKLLFDFLPVLAFFAVYKTKGIYFATSAAIIIALIQAVVTYARTKKLDTTAAIGVAVLLVFGGSTLLFHSPMYIKWKPTILYWVFSLVILVSQAGFKKNIIKLMLSKKIEMPDSVWNSMNAAWGAFFAVVGIINLYVVYNYSTDIWVNFKLFGIMGLMFVFVIIQSLFFAKHFKE